jgi:hypothetical protein
MRRFFTEQKAELTEMAAPKMPEGVKRKRSATYAHTHDIHIGSEHVATISGHQANRRMDGRGIPAHVKIYQVHHNEAGMLKSEYHKDHSDEAIEHRPTWKDDKTHPHGGGWDYSKLKPTKVRKPREYHSMEDAVHAVVNTHRNNQEFGPNHDPRERWKHAIKLASGHDEHEKQTDKYKTALAHVKQLGPGHDELVDALQHHYDAHVAKGSKPSQDKLKQWTHDAHQYTGTTYHPAKYSSDFKVKEKEAHRTLNHPEHHALATQAANVYTHGHPDGSQWERQRKANNY